MICDRKKIVFIFTFIFLILISISNVFAETCSLCGKEHAEGECYNQLNIQASGAETSGNLQITIGALKEKDSSETATDILTKYQSVISIISGVAALTMLVFFILNFLKIGKSAGNPQMRQSAMMGVIFTGIATVILGGVMTFFTFFYNFI